MHMRRGNRGLRASPERHLAPVRSIKDVALDARSRLTAGCNLICRAFHELRKIVHRLSLPKQSNPAWTAGRIDISLLAGNSRTRSESVKAGT